MDESKKLVGMAGLFDDPDALIAAAQTVRDAGYKQWDCHTPYPVHGLDGAMGLRRSPLGVICLTGGFLGAALAMGTQWWMSAVDYPVRIGGKPLFSWQAFVPVTFELFVLLAALATFGGMLVLCKLGRWHSPLHDSGLMEEVTTSRFGVVLGADDPQFEEGKARTLLEGAGCKDVRPVFENVEDEEAFL